jgi:hypothetical protein
MTKQKIGGHAEISGSPSCSDLPIWREAVVNPPAIAPHLTGPAKSVVQKTHRLFKKA